jgi:ABC-type Zn uptake system ZnuABC Zn-binding protein ZnuA
VRRLVLARSSSLLELGLRRVGDGARALARRLPRGAAFAAALVVAAPAPRPAEAELRVVATLPDLYVLTRAVAGTVATVDLVARFGQNPHDMEVRPSHILLVRRADVLVRNGLEEDAWIDVIARGSNNPKAQRGSPNVIVR